MLTSLALILRSKLMRLPRKMPEEASREDPEVIELIASLESPSNRRRRKSQLLMKLLNKRLRISLLPNVKTEEEETVRVNSDLYFNPSTIWHQSLLITLKHFRNKMTP